MLEENVWSFSQGFRENDAAKAISAAAVGKTEATAAASGCVVIFSSDKHISDKFLFLLENIFL